MFYVLCILCLFEPDLESSKIYFLFYSSFLFNLFFLFFVSSTQYTFLKFVRYKQFLTLFYSFYWVYVNRTQNQFFPGPTHNFINRFFIAGLSLIMSILKILPPKKSSVYSKFLAVMCSLCLLFFGSRIRLKNGRANHLY